MTFVSIIFIFFARTFFRKFLQQLVSIKLYLATSLWLHTSSCDGEGLFEFNFAKEIVTISAQGLEILYQQYFGQSLNFLIFGIHKEIYYEIY
jgi:hypothetical protein